MNTINTNNIPNAPIIMTANDFIPVEKVAVKTITPKTYMEINEVDINYKKYPSTTYDYWRCGVDMNTFKRFTPNFAKRIISIFDEEIVEQSLGSISMQQLTTTQRIPIENLDNVISYSNGILIGGLQSITVKHYKGDWMREEEAVGVNIILPSNYTSVYEGPIMQRCIEDKYPWVKNFKCSFYGFNGNDEYEFYVDVTPEEDKKAGKGENVNQTLYVSLKALTEKNPQIIKDRMESYFKFYYRNNEENYKRAMSALDTPLGKLFLNFVSGCYTQVSSEEKICEHQVRGCTYEYLILFTKGNHTSVKNFDSLNKAICSLKTKINSLLEDYGQDNITFTTDWPTATVKFIKNGLYELQLVRIVTKDINN